MAESIAAEKAQRQQQHAERIAAAVHEIVARVADPSESRTMALVSSPYGMDRNAALRDALALHARGRSAMIPAEGLVSEWDALAWIVGAREELESADVVVVVGLVARGTAAAPHSIIRLLTGKTVEVPVKHREPVGVSLRPGFSLILSEPSRTAPAARSVLDAIVAEIAVADDDGNERRPVTVLKASL